MDVPCNPEQPSDPWKRAAQCACQCPAAQKRPHPTRPVSHHLPRNTVHNASTYHSQFIKAPGLLNVPQRLLQIAQLLVNDSLGLLGALHSLRLKRLDSLDLAPDIVRLRLVRGVALLDLVDDGLVLEHGAVVCEVDGLRLLGEQGHFAARIVVALLEGLEGRGGLAADAELRAELGPVELEGGASLLGGCGLVFCAWGFGGLKGGFARGGGGNWGV